MESTKLTREAMYDTINTINAVEGFDPSLLAETYEGLDGKPVTGLPVAVQEAWFRLKYPEGRILVRTKPGQAGDSFVAHARVYKHYMDPVDNFLAEAEASRSASEKAPNVSVREWAQTAAIGIALRHAGFGLQFKVAGEPALIRQQAEGGAVPEVEQPSSTQPVAQAPAAQPAQEPDPLTAARQTVCSLKKHAGRTLGELVMLDPGFLKWLATKQREEYPELSAAAKLICDHALETA